MNLAETVFERFQARHAEHSPFHPRHRAGGYPPGHGPRPDRLPARSRPVLVRCARPLEPRRPANAATSRRGNPGRRHEPGNDDLQAQTVAAARSPRLLQALHSNAPQSIEEAEAGLAFIPSLVSARILPVGYSQPDTDSAAPLSCSRPGHASDARSAARAPRRDLPRSGRNS